MSNGSDSQNRSSILVVLASAKLAVATFSSRILGLIREQAMAAIFGASSMTDAFLVAFRIPNLLRDLFAEGAFSASFVPVFTEAKNKSNEEARHLLWASVILLGSITLFLVALIEIFAPQIILLLAPSFKNSPENYQMTIVLTRIMAPFLFLISLSALFMGALNTFKQFFLPALAPACFNIAMISCIFLLPDYFEERGIRPVFALGVGVLAGGAVQILLQLPLLVKNHLGPIPPKEIFSKYSKKVVTKIIPSLVGFAATQINIVITTILATGTVVGAVSWLNYAFRLFQFPVGIISVSISGSNLVLFSEAWKNNDKPRAIELLKAAYELSFFAIIPATALIYALAEPSVALVFERGVWSAMDTSNTAMVLRFYIVGLPVYGLYKIWTPTFYALDLQKVPVTASIISIVFNICFCWPLVSVYGFKILALGTSLSMLLNTAIQTVILKKELKLDRKFLFDLRLAKMLLAGGLCFLATRFSVEKLYRSDVLITEELMRFSLMLTSGVAVYLVTLFILGEGRALKSFVKRRK